MGSTAWIEDATSAKLSDSDYDDDAENIDDDEVNDDK